MYHSSVQATYNTKNNITNRKESAVEAKQKLPNVQIELGHEASHVQTHKKKQTGLSQSNTRISDLYHICHLKQRQDKAALSSDDAQDHPRQEEH